VWLTTIWSPLVTSVISLIKTPPPTLLAPFNSVVIPVEPSNIIYWTVLPTPVTKSPWTLSTTNCVALEIPTTDNLTLAPIALLPIPVDPILRTSPAT